MMTGKTEGGRPQALLVGGIHHPKAPWPPAKVPVSFTTPCLCLLVHCRDPRLSSSESSLVLRQRWWHPALRSRSHTLTNGRSGGPREAQAAHRLCPQEACALKDRACSSGACSGRNSRRSCLQAAEVLLCQGGATGHLQANLLCSQKGLSRGFLGWANDQQAGSHGVGKNVATLLWT